MTVLVGSSLEPIQCPTETIEGITYPATDANSSAVGPCPAGQSGSKTRFCKIDGTWDVPQGQCSMFYFFIL